MAALKDIAFEIIQKCPNNCLHCSSVASSESKHIIEPYVFYRVINDAIDLGLKHVSLSGGEPFEHPGISDIISFSKSKGLDVSVYTSGLWTRYGRVEPLSKELLFKAKKAGLKNIMFNLPSVNPQIYNAIMGTKGLLSSVLDVIKFSKEIGLDVEIHYVPMAINLASLRELLLFAAEYDIKVSFLRLVEQGRAVINKESININESFVKSYIHETKKSLEMQGIHVRTRNGTPLSDKKDESCCTAAKSKVIIRYDGAVFPCEAYKSFDEIKINGDKISPENINIKSIKEIWESSTFLMYLRAEMSTFFCNDCGSENCPAQFRLSSHGA